MKRFLGFIFLAIGMYLLIIYPGFYIYKHQIKIGFKNRHFYIKNLSFHIDGKNIKIRLLNIYRDGIALKDMFYESKPLFFYVKYGDVYFKSLILHGYVNELNIVLVAQDNKPSNVPNFNLRLYEKYYKNIDAKVDNLYIESADRFSHQSFALFIPQASLKDGILKTDEYANFIYLSANTRHELYVYIPKSYLKNGYFVAKDVNAVSNLYDFNLNFWWANRIGHALASGFITPINTPVFDTSILMGNIKAFINNKDITYDADFHIDNINIPKMRPFKNSVFSLKGFVNDNGVGFDGVLSNKSILANIDYKDKFNDFNIDIKSLKLNNKDFNLNTPIYVIAGGNVFYSIDKKLLKLDIKTSNIKIKNFYFPMGYIKGKVDFSKPHNKGKLLYALYGNQSVRGNIVFGDNTIQNISYLNAFNIKTSYASFYINGFIQSILYPNFYMEGFLKAKNIKSKYLDISEIPINFSYKDKTLTLASDSNILKANATYKNGSILANINPKNITLYKYIKNTLYIANLKDGDININNKNLNIKDVSFEAFGKNMKANGIINASGEINDISGDVVLNSIDYKFVKNAYVNVLFSYKSGDLNLIPSLKEKNFILTSNINISKKTIFNVNLSGANSLIALNVNIRGDIDNITNLEAKGYALYKKYNAKIPIDAYIKNQKGMYQMYVRGFSVNLNHLRFAVADITGISNSKNQINWQTKGVKVFLYNEPILSTSPIFGLLSLKPFYISSNPANIKDLLTGDIAFGYKNGIYLKSKGIMDIANTLSFMKSKLPFLLKGEIYYALNIDDKNIYFYLKSQKPVLLLSKYISLPLYAHVDNTIYMTQDGFRPTSFVFDSLDNKHQLLINIGYNNGIMLSSNFIQLPIYYDAKNFYYQGFFDGNINTNVSKTINITGNINPSGLVYVRHFGMASSGGGSLPKNLNINISFKNQTPLSIMLPEGNAYANTWGDIKSNKGHLWYKIYLKALGGELTYSQKDFYIRTGEVKATPNHQKINLLIMSPGSSYNTYISLNGYMDDLHFNIYSDPPMPKQELLSSFILNQSGLTAIPINELASKASKYSPSGIISKVFGTNVNVSVYPSQGSNGNMNTNMELSKKLTKNLGVKAHISTSKNPLDTYYGADVKLTPNTSLNFEMYGNGSSQGSISYEKHFDIGKPWK